MSNAATLSIFNNLFSSVAEEMGVTLEQAAYSPNIKERLDFSCAVFLADGRMLAQAAHIPVHLGAMPASVQAAIAECAPFAPGDVVMLNDPYLGGNHLPDITMVSPVFLEDPASPERTEPDDAPTQHAASFQADSSLSHFPSPIFFVASRAHHADVGGMSPGSMPLSRELYQEGVIIPPIKIVEAGQRNEGVWKLFLRNVRTPDERAGDTAAQIAAHNIGTVRLQEIIGRYGLNETLQQAEELIAYATRLTESAISQMPLGTYSFTDVLDNDGQSPNPIPIQVTIKNDGKHLTVDFTGTSPAVDGNLNTVPAVAESAVAYCVRCIALALLNIDLPMNDGAFAPVQVICPEGTLVNPRPPHAVAAGNVETSQRITDSVFGAFAQALPQLVPAASQGTMNNFTFGGVSEDGPFVYYETNGGGLGAGPSGSGGSGMHAHMSNTLNTPIEALEVTFPVRVLQYAYRTDSGGRGTHHGGEGLVREMEFLGPVSATIMSERRDRGPYGLEGGEEGAPGRNTLFRSGEETQLPGKITLDVKPGDRIRLETPGGGGWGENNDQ